LTRSRAGVSSGPEAGGGAEAPARAAAPSERAANRAPTRSHGDSDRAPDPNREGAWADTVGIVLAFAVAVLLAVVWWREGRLGLPRPVDRRRPFRAA
jgi:hypothetical protein